MSYNKLLIVSIIVGFLLITGLMMFLSSKEESATVKNYGSFTEPDVIPVSTLQHRYFEPMDSLSPTK